MTACERVLLPVDRWLVCRFPIEVIILRDLKCTDSAHACCPRPKRWEWHSGNGPSTFAPTSFDVDVLNSEFQHESYFLPTAKSVPRNITNKIWRVGAQGG